MPENWNDAYEILSNSRWLYHNSDYWEFLVHTVWKLDSRPCRVVEFGGGFGRLAMILLPLMAEGTAYTVFDTAETLLARGRAIFENQPYPIDFIRADVHHAPFQDAVFDIAISHTVLMHVPSPEVALAEMIRLTRPGGMIITCEASRNAFQAMFHIEESNELEEVPLELFQAMNRHIRRTTGIDYNLGARMPVLMHKAGLKNIQSRVTDAVRLLLPPLSTPEEERTFRTLCDEGFGWQPTDPKVTHEWEEQLMSYGVSREVACREVRRELDRDFAHKGRGYHTVAPSLLMFSYGTVHTSKGTD